MEEDYIEEMGADVVMQYPAYHVHAVILKRTAMGEWEVDNVVFDDFDTKADAMRFAEETVKKYGYLCRDCEVTQRVDTLTGEESRRVWFSEPWRGTFEHSVN